jgi:hypothetical protein
MLTTYQGMRLTAVTRSDHLTARVYQRAWLILLAEVTAAVCDKCWVRSTLLESFLHDWTQCIIRYYTGMWLEVLKRGTKNKLGSWYFSHMSQFRAYRLGNKYHLPCRRSRNQTPFSNFRLIWHIMTFQTSNRSCEMQVTLNTEQALRRVDANSWCAYVTY